jgi:cyanophycin synthetase
MDEYTRVKEVVPKSTRKDGYTVLNADDDRVYAMKDKVSCSVVLFSMDPENPRILDHAREGGMTITIEDGQYTMYTQGQRATIIAVNDIPLTYEGTADFMVKNILPAIGAAFLSGISVDVIRKALANFSSSPTTTPGRMNLFDFGDFKVMLDYAHNAAGFKEVEKYMSTVNADKKVGIIAATGDRKEEDILTQGKYAAKIFDEIIIRHDRDSRSRTNDQLTELLKQGIASVKSDIPVTVISDEHEAVGHAISTATPDTFIFTCADNVYDSIEIIESFQRKVKK